MMQAGTDRLLFVGLSAVVVMLLLLWPTVDLSLGGDQYVELARSLLRGSLNVDSLDARYRDYVQWNGHKYLPFGPLPALLLVPFVPLLNAGVPLVLVGYAFGILNGLLFDSILSRLKVPGERRAWLLLLYFGGTVYLSVTLVGISTFFAHVVTTTFLLLAIREALGSSRFVLIGVLLGLAAASRMTALFALPFFVLLAHHRGFANNRDGFRTRPTIRFVSTASLLLGAAVPMTVVLFYNYARFGDPLETGFGLALLYSPVLDDARNLGLFSLAHVPKNVYNMWIALPEVVTGREGSNPVWPFIRPSPWGMGLFFTTPALVYVFRAKLKDPLVQASWLAVAATLVPIVTYYGIGYVQFGFRYALDFMPFLMLLVAAGMPLKLSRTAVALITASVVINVWGAIFLAIWI